MGSELYETLPLEDLVTIHDKDRKPVTKSDRKAGPYPYYGASGITDYVENYIFDGDYVLLAEDGDNLRTRNTPIAFMARGKFWVNNHAHIVKAKGDESSDYICYALQVADVTSYISGSTRPKITQADMKKIPVSAPPKDVRNSIAHILSSLDNKIQLNRQTNQTLEAMAQALFKSWFVDFDPVFDNIIAHNLAHNNEPLHNIPEPLLPHAQRRLKAHNVGRGSARQTAAHAFHHLFPQAFEQSDEPSVGIQGWIPKGWGVVKSGEVIDVRDGTHDSPKKSEAGYPLVTSKHITSGSLKLEGAYLISENDFLNINKRSKVETGDILLTMIGTVGVPYLVLEQPALFAIKNVGLFRTSEAPSLKNYFFQLLKSEPMQNYLEARMAGTTQKYLSLKALRNIEMTLPKTSVLEEFNGVINLLNDKLKSNLDSASKLESLRDTLLPKLISGELRIPEAVQASEALAK